MLFNLIVALGFMEPALVPMPEVQIKVSEDLYVKCAVILFFKQHVFNFYVLTFSLKFYH
jgi:hypothetical protein